MLIVFKGFLQRNKVNFILFSDENDKTVEIPIEQPIMERMNAYLSKLKPKDKLKENKESDDE
jgi:hypothetical protein